MAEYQDIPVRIRISQQSFQPVQFFFVKPITDFLPGIKGLQKKHPQALLRIILVIITLLPLWQVQFPDFIRCETLRVIPEIVGIMVSDYIIQRNTQTPDIILHCPYIIPGDFRRHHPVSSIPQMEKAIQSHTAGLQRHRGSV